jgi:hypothetical protein
MKEREKIRRLRTKVNALKRQLQTMPQTSDDTSSQIKTQTSDETSSQIKTPDSEIKDDGASDDQAAIVNPDESEDALPEEVVNFCGCVCVCVCMYVCCVCHVYMCVCS